MPDDSVPPDAEGTRGARQQLGDFTLLELIGEGGSAVVYRALNRTFNGTVALKCWRMVLTESQRAKFLEECKLQWRLSDHPNIVRLYWADAPVEEPAWLASELYETSLAERLRTEPPLMRHEALGLADDVLAGLEAIHSERMLHRDVKPANVLLKGGTAALADLGITMHLEGWTRDAAAGTDMFVAPELLRGAPPDFRSDVYSAAVTVRMMLGRDVPAPIEALLTRAASFTPQDRPADATELRRQLWVAREQVRRLGEARRAEDAGGSGWVLAVDVGSTATAAAIRELGQAPRLLDIDGQTRVPTVVFVDDAGRLVVGSAAEQLAHGRPANSLRTLKARIGDPTAPVLAGQAFPVGVLLGALLRYVYDEAVTQQGEPPSQLRLTHPATWNRPRIADLLAAASTAGLPDAVPVPEPVAAAAGAGQSGSARQGELVAVYDLGGGTFDTAVLRVTAAGFEVAGRPAGDSAIGGNLFDELVVKHLGAQLDPDIWRRLQTAPDVAWARAAAALRSEARRVKEALSQHDYAEAVVALPSGLVELRVTRDEFDQMVEPYVEETADVVVRCLEDIEVAPGQLASLCIVGGASRSPVVERLLRERLPDAPVARRGDPKGTVALGATNLLLIPSQQDRARQPGHEGWTVARPGPISPGRVSLPPPGAAPAAVTPSQAMRLRGEALADATPSPSQTPPSPPDPEQPPPVATSEPILATSSPSEPGTADPPVGAHAETSQGESRSDPAPSAEANEPPSRRQRRRRVILAVSAIAAIAAVAAAAVRWWPSEPSAAAPTSPWKPLQRLQVPHQQAAATVTANGQIWVLGGLTGDGQPTNDVEYYDPRSGSWTTVGAPPVQLNHAMAVNYDGDILLMGGFIPKVGKPAGAVSDQVWRQHDGKWSLVGHLSHARAAAAAVVVGDKIVLAGGRALDSARRAVAVTQTEIFDGTKWTDTTPIPTARDHLAAAADGHYAYFVGGRHFSADANVAVLQRLDPETGHWVTLAPMPTARGDLGAAMVGDLLVTVGGEGRVAVDASVEAYSVSQQSWTSLPPLRMPRHGASVVSLTDRVYAIGGATRPDHMATTAAGEVLDLTSMAKASAPWHRVENLTQGVQQAPAAVVDGQICVVGGLTSLTGSTTSVQCLDPVIGQWKKLTDLPRPLNHAMAVTYREKLTVLGGFVPQGSEATAGVSDMVLQYDRDTGRWRELPRLRQRRAAGAAVVIRNRIIVSGGRALDQDNQLTLIRTTEEFDGIRWRDVAPMPTPRDHLAAATDGRYAYFVGGRDLYANRNSDALERYDPADGTWTRLPRMPEARGGLGAAMARGILVTSGGEESNRADKEAQGYDTTLGAWFTLHNLDRPRHGAAMAAINDRTVYVIGGGTMANHLATTGEVVTMDLG
jgi:N-acetylneuraminic acid mutarotase/actin-like ATPase involved in cell morphogenesis